VCSFCPALGAICREVAAYWGEEQADNRDTRQGGRDGGEVWAENGSILMYSYALIPVEQCILHAGPSSGSAEQPMIACFEQTHKPRVRLH
jgi:hypothetical protein